MYNLKSHRVNKITDFDGNDSANFAKNGVGQFIWQRKIQYLHDVGPNTAKNGILLLRQQAEVIAFDESDPLNLFDDVAADWHIVRNRPTLLDPQREPSRKERRKARRRARRNAQ